MNVWLIHMVNADTYNAKVLEMGKAILVAIIASLWAAPAWGFENDDLKRFLKTGACAQCDLSKANLENADLTGADLSGADHRGARFWQAKLDGTKGFDPAQF